MGGEIREAFLRLVRLGIGNGDVGLDSDVFGSVDWDAFKALAERQGLSAIVADGIECLPMESRPPKTLMLQLIGEVLQDYEYRHKLYLRAIAELAGFYNSHGIRMMVLKGSGLNLNYPIPKHRPTGDMDIYLFGKHKEADRLIREKFGIMVDSGYHT